MAKQEPKVRKDGMCVVCLKQLTTVERYGDRDAFCSACCCREFFGTQITKPNQHERRAL